MSRKGVYSLSEIVNDLSRSNICFRRSASGEDEYDPSGLCFTLYICDGGNNCIDSISFDAVPTASEDGLYHIMYNDKYRLLTGVINDFRNEERYYNGGYDYDDGELPF